MEAWRIATQVRIWRGSAAQQACFNNPRGFFLGRRVVGLSDQLHKEANASIPSEEWGTI